MLDTIRKRKENLISMFIILAIVAVMALYGVDKVTKADGGHQGGVVAYVNGEPISSQEFGQELQMTLQRYQAMFGGQFDEKMLQSPQAMQGTLQQLVKMKLLNQQAKKLKVFVTNNELADHIKSIPYYQKNGKFDAETYSKLPNRGAEEKSQRERLLTSKWYNFVSDRVRLTPTALKQGYLMKESKLDLDYAKIEFNKLAPKNAVSAKETEQFLKTSENEAKQYYESHKDEYTEKGERNFRQIRAAIPFQANDKQKADAKKKIEDIAKQLTADNFEKTAKEKSDDEFAKKGGNRGWVKEGVLEKELELALSKMQPKQVSPIVSTSFGYYLLQLVESKAPKAQTYDQVKNKVAETLVSEKAAKDWADKTRASWEALVKDGKSLDSELKKYKVEIKKTGPFDLSQGYIPSLGQNDAILDAAMELTKEKPVAKKLFFVQDGYYYIKLGKFDVPKLADLEKKLSETDKTLVSGLQNELITDWLNDLEKKATIKNELPTGPAKGAKAGDESAEG